jgi:hypothetical protein
MAISLRSVGAVAAALSLAGGAFLAGRFAAPVSDAGPASAAADPCADAWEVVRQANDDALATEGDVRTGHLRTGANAILQNPDCFGARERAVAQSALDAINVPRDRGLDPIDTFLLND